MSERQELRNVGMRTTRPRVLILEILEAASEDSKHLSAEDIYRQMSEHNLEIGIATIYRVLTQFVSAGLVTRHVFDNGAAVYELARGEHHDHMVCLETGAVIEFVNAEIEDLQQQIAEAHGYNLVDHNLVLYVRPNSPDK